MTPEAPGRSFHASAEAQPTDVGHTGDRTHSAIAFIKGDMTKNMASSFPNVHDEIRNSVSQDIGDCSGAYAEARSLEIEHLNSHRVDSKECVLARG